MNVIVNAFYNIDNPLPIQFFTANNYHIQENIRCPEGFSIYNQILIVLDGTGILNCKGKSYPLKKGSAFFLEKGIPCEYLDTGGLVSAYVTAYGTAVREIAAHYECDGFYYYESIPYESFVNDITDIINEFHSRKRMNIISAMVYDFYLKFFELETHDRLTDLERTAEYIKFNYYGKLTLGKIASVYGSSVAKLCRDFKNEYGCTVMQHILDLRLDIAESLLKTDRTLRTKDVALAVGFEDSSYFCRMYKRKFGYSPLKSRD